MDPHPTTDPIDGDEAAAATPGLTPEAIRCLVLSATEPNGEEAGQAARGSAPGQEPGKALTALSDLLRSARLEFVGNLDAARRWLDQEPAAMVLVVYPDPVLELARQLDLENCGAAPGIGDDPSEWLGITLLAWVEELLGLHRRHRRRFVLVNGHAALADPEGLAQQLQQRLGVVIDPAQSPPTSSEPSAAPSALAIALAQAIAQADDAPGSPLAGLEASSLPLAPIARLGSRAAMEAWRSERIRAHQAFEDQVRRLAEENELLLAQLHQVQEEFETYFLAHRDLLRAAETDGDLSATVRRRGAPQHEAESAELAAHAKRLETDLQAVHASLSWKITAPLRALARPLMSKRAD